MDKANFYCYAAGKESESVCRDITGEVNGVYWHLGNVDYNQLVVQTNNADLMFIIADLNNLSEVNNVEFVVKLAEYFKVPILVYALYPIKLIPQFSEKRTWLSKIDKISQTAVVMILDDDLLQTNFNKSQSLIQHYINSGFACLSIKLMIAIRAIVDPFIRQEVVGIDFADYCLAFTNKGSYQVKRYSYEALNQIENNKNLLQAKVIIVSIYLSKDGVAVFSDVLTTVNNMLKKGNALLIAGAIIEERQKGNPLITISYKNS